MKQDIALDDGQIIKMIRSGDTDIFAVLIRRYQYPIGRYLFRLVGNYEVAEDLAQDTFIKAYEWIVNTENELAFKSWLFRIATNTCVDYIRRRKFHEYLPINITKNDNNQKTDIEEKILLVHCQH